MGNELTSLSASIKAEMARAGLSQQALAGRLGMKQPALSRRLTGTTDWSVPEIVLLAEVLDVPLSALLPMQASA